VLFDYIIVNFKECYDDDDDLLFPMPRNTSQKGQLTITLSLDNPSIFIFSVIGVVPKSSLQEGHLTMKINNTTTTLYTLIAGIYWL
jgi:hypothetical protein